MRIRSAWRQLAPGRVHALEDELRVVLVAVERDVHDHQLRQALAERRQLVLDLSHALLEELEVLLDPDRVVLRLRLLVEQGDAATPCRSARAAACSAARRLQGVEQVVVAQLLRREAVHRLAVAQAAGPAPRGAASPS